MAARERKLHAEMELRQAQAEREQWKERHAKMEQQEEVVRVQLEEAALATRHEELAARREEQQAQQKEAAMMQRAGEKRKQEEALAEPRQQSAEERRGRQEGHAVSSRSGQAATNRRSVPVCSNELRIWLARHTLTGVHECDSCGWFALHHVARDSRSDQAAEGIFDELCKHGWLPEQVNVATGKPPESMHLPQR